MFGLNLVSSEELSLTPLAYSQFSFRKFFSLADLNCVCVCVLIDILILLKFILIIYRGDYKKKISLRRN